MVTTLGGIEKKMKKIFNKIFTEHITVDKTSKIL